MILSDIAVLYSELKLHKLVMAVCNNDCIKTGQSLVKQQLATLQYHVTA